MDSRLFSIDSIVTVHGLGKDWASLGHHTPAYVQRRKHRTGDQSGQAPDGSDREEAEKERERDEAAPKGHSEGFEVTV